MQEFNFGRLIYNGKYEISSIEKRSLVSIDTLLFSK